jgi:hypothetical protein
VTIEAIKAAIQSAAAKMDREHDLLALILTSHGSPDGVAVQAGRRDETLSPSALARLLDGAGVRHRIVIISARYSGAAQQALHAARPVFLLDVDEGLKFAQVMSVASSRSMRNLSRRSLTRLATAASARL